MKTSKFILSLVTAASLAQLAACSGGGGGGGSASPSTDSEVSRPSGSATFTNLSSPKTDFVCEKNNIFIATNTNVYPDRSSCEAASGNWQTGSVAVPVRCQVGTAVYIWLGQGLWPFDADDEASCLAFGGTIIPATSVTVGACDRFAGANLSCAQLGGVQVAIHGIEGGFVSSDHLIAGRNIITGEADLNGNLGLSCTIQDSKGCLGHSATEKPYMFFAMNTIKLGVDRWITSIYKKTGTSFTGYTGSPTDTPSFSVSLPTKGGTDGASVSTYTFPILFYLSN